MPSRHLNTLFIVFLLLLLFLQGRLWFESGGILDMIQLKKQVAHVWDENQRLKQRNQSLMQELAHFKKNNSAMESRARQDLGMIKKDETFYQVVS